MRKWITTPGPALCPTFRLRVPHKTARFRHPASVGLCIWFTAVLALLTVGCAWGDEPEGKAHATPTPPPIPPTSQQTAAAYARVDDFQAAATSDPDGNQLQFHWIAYGEAGYRVFFQRSPSTTISGADNVAATVTISSPGTVHVILAVTDNGTPNLTSYRRVILNVTSPQ